MLLTAPMGLKASAPLTSRPFRAGTSVKVRIIQRKILECATLDGP